MENYPPGDTALHKSCKSIIAARAGASFHSGDAAWSALSDFLHGGSSSCYNLSAQLPVGTSPTISSGDWSGVGGGRNGLAWDYETCTMLIEKLGTNNRTDMFPKREWTMSWLQQHCQARFGVKPQPTGA
jgi:hypothetical protein